MDFIRRMKAECPAAFQGGAVVEFGAYNINGSARSLFEADEYVGVDWRPGPGVDVVSLAHEFQRQAGSCDTVLATQMLEHDPYWQRTLAVMVDLVRPGGYMLLTWAGPGWATHEVDTAPLAGYYGNLAMADVRVVVIALAGWQRVVYDAQGEPPDLLWMGMGKT